MTIKTILSHPFTLVTSFLLVFISGHQTGNFYFSYMMLGLFYGYTYSIVGTLGIAVIFTSHFVFKESRSNLEASFINLIGAILLIVSLFLFYYRLPAFNLPPTFFSQPAHMLSLFSFCILATCFVTIFPLTQKDTINHDLR